MTEPKLYCVANARIPSKRAQSLQVVQMAAAFQRAGAATTLLHARRHPTPALPPGEDLFSYYAVGSGERPAVEALACVDWIDRVPTRLQYVPARVQELSFSRAAARRIGTEPALVYCREVEAARHLVRRGHPSVFLEIHRVPGGRLRRKWTLEAAARARGIVAISGGVREDLGALGVDLDSIVVEPDGFEVERFQNLPTREEARRELGLEPGARVAVYTGGLMEWKGVGVLLEAARLVPEVTFVIAGGTEADVARLQARAAGVSNVRLDGFQPPQRVVQYLAAADIGVVPNRSKPTISARYTSPLKIFEAMAVGLPLVASNLASIREILQEKKSTLGILAAPDSASALANSVRSLMEDEAGRAEIRTRSLERAKHYGWDARAARILEWMAERTKASASA